MSIFSRLTAGNVISRFGSAPIDADRKGLIAFTNSALAEDASATPVTSPVTGTSAVTLNIPENAVNIVLAHDASSQQSTVTFNGQGGSFGLVANQVVKIGCAGAGFNTIAITPGATTTNIYFAFELV